MIGSLLALFLAGTAFGVAFVLSFFICRVASEHRVRSGGCFGNQTKRRPGRGSAIARFLFDFAVAFSAGAYLVLYDATVLGGRGRIVHLAAFFLGVILVRILFLKLLFRQTERAVSFAFALISVVMRWLCLPLRKCFSVLFAILFRLYLILKRKNDKMRRKRRAKREIAGLRSMMDDAFLSSAVTEAIASGRD